MNPETSNIQHPTPNIEGISPEHPEHCLSMSLDRGCVADQPQHVRMRCGWLSAQPRSGSWVQCANSLRTSHPKTHCPMVSQIQITPRVQPHPSHTQIPISTAE